MPAVSYTKCPDTMSIEARLRELELELLQPAVRRNPERLASLLAEGFRDFGSSGRIFTRDEVIEALGTESQVHWSISDFRAEVVRDGVALVTYRAVRRGEADQSEAASSRSSLWVMRDGEWQMLFHQGTPIPLH